MEKSFENITILFSRS